jgi:hypothetical protein
VPVPWGSRGNRPRLGSPDTGPGLAQVWDPALRGRNWVGSVPHIGV